MFIKIIKPGLDGFTMIESSRMTVSDTICTREELLTILNGKIEFSKDMVYEVDFELAKHISESNEKEYDVRIVSYSIYNHAAQDYYTYMSMYMSNITCYFLDEKGNTIDTRKPKRRS